MPFKRLLQVNVQGVVNFECIESDFLKMKTAGMPPLEEGVR